MEYKISKFNSLLIYDDKNNLIFGISENNRWIKYEFDHNGSRIYYQDGYGRKHNKIMKNDIQTRP